MEVFAWAAVIKIMAGMLPNWEAWDPITLPNWHLMEKQCRIEAVRYMEQIDVDLAVIACHVRRGVSCKT